MKYEMKQRRLRYIALGTIIILCLALVVICTLEMVWHVEAHSHKDSSDEIFLKLQKLESFQYAIEVVFFTLAFGALIYLYRRLTNCFLNSNARPYEIKQT